MNLSFLSTGRFWIATLAVLFATGLFFAWELNGLTALGLPGPPRFAPTTRELTLTVLIALLFSVNMGLIVWQKRYGVCSMGTRRATGTAGIMGAIALVCPVCVLVPFTIAGISLSLVFLAPFVLLIQVIAIVLLCTSLYLLLPRS